MIYQKYIKRGFDIVLSLCGLLVLSPLFVITACIVRVKLGSPIIFCQERPGYKEKIFNIYKFRSMTNETDEFGQLLPNDKRLTKFGKKLRSLSLDELPQLWNILKGDMSIIGPRALRVEYLPLYSKEQHHRHDVKPGIVGLAALTGRNNQSWENKFKQDIYYVNNISFILDLKIFFGAVKVVLSRKGVAHEGSETAIPFTGN